MTLALLCCGTFLLRFIHAGAVAADPYYDSAIRSMGSSLHNFIFGSLEPGGTVSLDKPPLDLWPAVLSTKLFGLSALAMRLPEILGGSAAVALLFLAVRSTFGYIAGAVAAAALAVMPIEVITARSDTTDSLMMALCVLALYLLLHGLRYGRRRWLIAAAAALGVAFNVKLAESWLALPPLALILWLGLHEKRERLRALAACGAAYVAVALCWLTFTLLVPARAQPYAVGSTNGSPWNAAFIFNGLDRLRSSQSIEGSTGVYDVHRHYPQATQAQRDRIPITPPTLTRLLVGVGPLAGERLGFELLAALIVGGVALLSRGRRARNRAEEDPRPRLRRALAWGIALWLLEGILLFSAMARLHPRYTEAFLPAVAAALGIAVAAVVRRVRGWEIALLAVALSALVAYAHHLLFAATAAWWATLALAISALALIALAARAAPTAAKRLRGAAAAALASCLLAIPLSSSLQALAANTSDGNVLGALPGAELSRLSAYLRSHRGSAHFETAYDSATRMGALVLHDGLPVLPLTSNEGLILTKPQQLAAEVRAGRVRYAVLSGRCRATGGRADADCSAPVAWVISHGQDVSAQALLPPGTLWRLAS